MDVLAPRAGQGAQEAGVRSRGWSDGTASPEKQWELPGYAREMAEQMGEAVGCGEGYYQES